jgi:hypothetical protein
MESISTGLADEMISSRMVTGRTGGKLAAAVSAD